ncbi:MAG: HAMP domain-containing protein, partial [Planctomycetes bacterium]|nr:HAMP domain-containing protein [Planctomycetota bacterium]
MNRSIRRTLLFWYALILLGVIAAFGAVLAVEVREAALRQVDSEVTAHAQALVDELEPQPGGHFELELSDEYVRYFRRAGPDTPYYAIWDEKGAFVDRSRPDVEPRRPSAPEEREDGTRREHIVAGPGGTLLLVGRDTRGERERLRDFLGMVLGAGAGVLVLALGGGWFLAGRALEPIDRITRAAAAISASNLSQRVDVAHTESELGRLAKTLNETFERLQGSFERQTRFT